MPKGPMTRQRTRNPDSPPAELVPIVSSSSSHVTPHPPTATQTDADGAYDGDEAGPEEFMGYTDENLEERIKRLSRQKLYLYLPDGGEKMRKFVYRMKKELDRRRAARPTKVDTGHGQAVNIVGWNDPNTLMPPPVENASNHAPIINSGGLNPLASTNLEGQAVKSTNVGAKEVQPTAYACPGQKGEDTGKKRQLSQMAMLLEVENYLELKMKQIQKLVEEVKEAPKQEDIFTIEKCVAALEAIEELTDVEKAKALKLFKCGLNREIFMNIKSASVRLIWLKKEIDA